MHFSRIVLEYTSGPFRVGCIARYPGKPPLVEFGPGIDRMWDLGQRTVELIICLEIERTYAERVLPRAPLDLLHLTGNVVGLFFAHRTHNLSFT